MRLSIPNAVAMLATALVAIAETSYVGRLGIASLAGMALVFPMVMLQQMMSAGAMGGGVSSAISRALGAGDQARANALAVHAMMIGALAGAFFTVLFLVSGPRIYQLLGGRDATLAEALAYSNVVFIGATGIWLTNTLASVVRGSGNMKVPSVTLLAAAAIQVVVGAGLGLGLGPLPRLGMAGIALGQAVAFCSAAAFLYLFLRSRHARVKLSLGAAGVQREMFFDILKVGAVACVSPLQTVLTVLVLTRLISRFGTEALAGYGIGARLEFLLVPITFAIGVACVPMVGMAIGAGDVRRARRVAWTGGAVSAVIIGTIGALVAIFPDLWAGLFTSDPAVLDATRSYLRLSGPCFGFLGLALCLYFASQGSGKILGPVLGATVRLAVVALGGWWLASRGEPAWTMFAMVGASMVAYGCATAFAVRITRWGR
ncbi:MAG TPA: MATE family efflux transporter [Burkholderiaceae bacterium]|nr:MATE family efflux transporter [Burkholderiaceae bacterium]